MVDIIERNFLNIALVQALWKPPNNFAPLQNDKNPQENVINAKIHLGLQPSILFVIKYSTDVYQVTEYIIFTN